jgi:type VI secretion system secreted protein Hcp
MTLTGENQGAINGSCQQAGHEDTILVEEFDHEIYIPHDVQTGLASGKRVHGEFTVTKFFDQASPLIASALCNGEHMTDVTLKFYRIAPTGNEEHYYTIMLENAVVVRMNPYVPNCLDAASETYGHMEKVAFTYERITWTYEETGATATDDWQAPQ